MNTAITIPGYEFQHKIEESTTATLWRARQESLDRDVAIKILKPEFVSQAEEVEAFLREARAVAKLKSGNIIQVYDVCQHADTLFVVMECVDGHPLTTLLDLGDPIAQKRALSIALAVAQALSDAWNVEKIIHRNIKPANIMIEKGGGVKVANLGMSAIAGENPGFIIGTPSYMSPEQANAAGPVDFTSDMYSLGAVLYHMVTGQLPFADLDEDATLQAQIEGQLTFPQDLNPDITPPCAQLIARLMMKDPRKRYPDWKSAINDIAKLAAGKMIVTKPLAGAGSTIAAKGAGKKVAIKAPPPKKIIARPPSGNTAAPAVARATATPADNSPSAAETAAQAAARAAALKKKYGKPTTPLWIKLPLAAALMALFGWLGFTLLWQPYREAYPRVTLAAPEPAQMAPLPAQPSPPPTRPQPVPAAPEDTEVYASTEPPDDVTETAYPSQTEPPPPNSPVPEPPAPRLDALKNSLVETALAEGLEAAARTLRQQQGTPGASELAGFFAPSNQPEAIIADAFEELVGQETYVEMGGRRIEFRVEGVDGNTISTMVRSSTGNSVVYRPAQFKVSQLPLEEQRRWLGKAETPEKAFAAAMLDLSTANYTDLATQAEKCGPLADATRAFAQKRIDMLLE